MFIATAASLYFLGHWLRTFTAMARSPRPFTLCGTVKMNISSIRTGGDGEYDGRSQFSVKSRVVSVGLRAGNHQVNWMI